MESIKARVVEQIMKYFIVLTLLFIAPCAHAQSPYVDNGLNWLSATQSPEGKWGNINGIRDTQVVTDTLSGLGKTDEVYQKGITWISGFSLESNDFFARRILAQAGAGSVNDADLAALAANQNPDGGWGYYAGYDSDVYDTAIVLHALQAAKYQNSNAAKIAIDYLSSRQNENGSWSLLVDEPGDVTTTALSAIVLKRCQDSGLPVPLSTLSKANTWLATKQNADGGFGSSPSTVYETSLALSALIENGQAQAQTISNAMNYLAANQNANGSWNNSAYETGLAVKVLAMLKPNLSIAVSDVTLSNKAPLSGDIVKITVAVRNTGTATAQNVPVQVFAESAGGQQVQIGTTQVIPELGIGANTTISFDLDTAGKDGLFTIILKIDPENTIEEISNSDNQVSTNITITPRKPDLSINSTDLTLSKLSATSGDVVKINAVIRNIGNSDAVNVPILVLAESPAHVITQIASETLPLVTSNGSASVEVDFDTTGKDGAYTVSLRIDPNNLIDEFLKTNNQASKALTITPLKPDLSTAAADFTAAPAAARSGETVKITGTVRNTGTVSALNVPVRIVAESSTHEIVTLTSQTIPEVPVGGSLAVTADFVTKDLQGSYAISLQIDTGNTIDELSKTNNQVSLPIFITPVPDLIVTSLATSKNFLTVGDDVSFTATVGNQGNSPAGSFDLGFYVNSVADANLIGTTSIPALNPGESAVRYIVWKSNLAGTGMKIIAVADSGNKVAEMDKSNNQASQLFDVMATDANLSVSYRDITLNPPVALQGSAQEIAAAVRNTGFAGADAVDVAFYNGDPKSDGVLLGKKTITSIPAGASAQVSFAWQGIPDSGMKNIFVVVDPANVIKEFNKDDNSAFVIVNILSLPDLAITGNAITISPDYPVTGKSTSVSVAIANKGDQDATNVTVQMKDESSVIDSQVIPLVRGNSLLTASFAYPTAGKTGAHTLTVVVDLDNAIVEQSKDNNTATKSMVVRNDKIWASEPFFSPNGDGIKDTTDFFFSLEVPATVKVAVVNKKGEAVRIFSRGELDNTSGTTITWDGKNDSGMVVIDGKYSIRVVDQNGKIIGELSVVVDTNRSVFSDAIGTSFLITKDFNDKLPQYSKWEWFPDESGLLIFIEMADPNSPEFSKGLYKISTDGKEINRLVPEEWNDEYDPNYFYTIGSYGISPDGEQVAFVMYKYPKIYGPGLIEQNQLWVVDNEGSSLQLVDGNDVYGDISWSPDGKYILYSKYGNSNMHDVMIATRDGVHKKKIDSFSADITRQIWSPDSSKVVMQTASNNITLRVADTLGNAREVYSREVTPYDPLNTISNVEWSTTGNKLFISFYKGGWHDSAWIIDTENAEASIKTPFYADRHGTYYPHTGKYELDSIYPRPFSNSFAFSEERYEDNVTSIYLSGADGNTSVLYDAKPACDDGWLSVPVLEQMQWSLDGNKLAFWRFDGCDWTSKGSSLVVLDLKEDTRKVYDFSDHATGRDRNVEWLSDNSSILVWYDDFRGTRQTYVVNADSGETVTVNPYINSDGPTVSPRQNCIGYEYYHALDSTFIDAHPKYLYLMRSLLNLTADLRISRMKSMVVLQGTAQDALFDGYRLEYADAANPANWNLILPPSDSPVIDGVFTTWAPPYEGTFNVRLTVWDKAGNTAVSKKRISWGERHAYLSNIYRAAEFFSPNGDGVKDTVELHYTVNQPAHLEFSVVDESDEVATTIQKDYSAAGNDFISWDGRDSSGKLVPDGKYKIRVLDLEFPVSVDSTFPLGEVAFTGLTRVMPSYSSVNIVQGGGGQGIGPQVVVSTDLMGYAFDGNLKNWVLEYGIGNDPQEWFEYDTGGASIIKKDQNNNPLMDPPQSIALAVFRDGDLEWLTGKKFRLTVTDSAGNIVQKVAELSEGAFITKFDGEGFIVNALPASVGRHTIAAAALAKNPIEKAYVQYRIANVWTDAPLPSNDLSKIEIYLTDQTDAVRIKIIDITGNIIYSQSVYVGMVFAITDLSCLAGAAEIKLPEALTDLKFQINGSDYFVMRGVDLPTGRFKIPALPPVQGSVRMIGIGASGKTYCDGCYPKEIIYSCDQPRLSLNAIYKEADCGQISSHAELSTTIGNPDSIPIAYKSLTVYQGNDLLATFNLNGGEPRETIKLDTSRMPEGSYPVKAVLNYLDLQTKSSVLRQVEDYSTLVVDRVLPGAQVVYPGSSQEVCPVRVSFPAGDRVGVPVEALITDNIGVGEFELFYGSGNNPATWLPALKSELDKHGEIVQTRITGKGPANGRIGIMDVTGLPAAEYSLKLKAVDTSGNTSCSTSTFTLPRTVEVVYVRTDEPLLSPNGDGVMDGMNASFAINKPASVDARIFKALDNASGLDTTPLMTLISGQQYLSGMATVYWDGRNIAGTVVSDGQYGVVVTATDMCGYAVTKRVTVEVDNTAPTAAISYPKPADPLPSGNVIEVKGTATDTHFKSYTLEAGKGDIPSTWVTVASGPISVNDNIIGAWNTFGNEGRWTLRLTAVDKAGNKSITTSTIDLDARKTLVKSLDIAPKLFSPNNDNKLDTIRVGYELTDACQVKIDVIDAAGNAVKNSTVSFASAGSQSYLWDGKNNAGATVADGTYQVKLAAQLLSNPAVTQVETITVVVDTTQPRIDIKQPTDKAYLNSSKININGTISDQNILSYSLNITGPVGVLLQDAGNQDRNEYSFGSLDNLAEGNYALTAEAKDLGENTTRVARAFTIDRTPPKVMFDPSKLGEYYGSSKNVINVAGSIDEKNPERYSLRFGQGELPTEWKELVGAEIIPTTAQIYSWPVGKDDGVPDGVYTLSLYVKDKVGLEGEAKARIVIDNTPPEVAVTSPVNGEYARKAVDIKGKIHDANLDKGVLEISSGDCGNAYKWAPLKTFAAPVNNGALAVWQALPPDGDYCLRLSVVDRLGNKASTSVSVKIDTHPPSSPVLTGKIDSKSNVRLDWTRNGEADLAGYNLYRDGQKLNGALLTDTTYWDSNLKENAYSYVVTAVDFAGNESQASNPVKLSIDLTGPSVGIFSPQNGARIGNILDIKGTAFSANDFKHFGVYFSQAGTSENWTLIRMSSVPISYGVIAEWDTTAMPDGVYSLKLEGEDLTGNVTVQAISVTIDNTPPVAPILLSAAANGADVTLSWQANTENDLAGYLAYRNYQVANAKGMLVTNIKPYLLTGTSFIDKSLPDGEYRYILVAVDQAVNMSNASREFSVTVDTHPPHTTIIEPVNSVKLEGKTLVRADSPDNDIASVQFKYKRAQDSTWTNLGVPVTGNPSMIYFDPKALGLPYGDYHLMAIATDNGGRTDSAPAPITMTYTDLTPPVVPLNLRAATSGNTVNLSWSANTELDLAGYNIYRTNGTTTTTKINWAPAMNVAYQDANLADGTYSYVITAIDFFGNESKPTGGVSAKVYAPLLTQPFTPVNQPAMKIVGANAAPNSSVELYRQGQSSLGKVTADPQGNLVFDNLVLVPGENSLTATSTDSAGNLSRASDAAVVLYGQPPAQPSGVSSAVEDYSVSLAWNPNQEADIVGYNVYRDGVKLNLPQPVTTGQASASSFAASSYQPNNAFDGAAATVWMSPQGYGTFTPAWWEVDFPTRELVSHLEIHWQHNDTTTYSGKDFEVQGWSGYAWITLATVKGNSLNDNSFDFAPSYPTDKIRISITDTNQPYWKQAGIFDVKILKEALVSASPYQDTSLHDGKYHYTVTAVSSLGFESLPSDQSQADVGDVIPPTAPRGLAASVTGSSAVLSWTPNGEPDLAGYNIYRNLPDGWQKLNTALVNGVSFSDHNLVNSMYVYHITGVDKVGNESDPSSDVAATIAVTPLQPPGKLSVTPVPEGRALTIAWGTSGELTARYYVHRGVISGGPYARVAMVPGTALSYQDSLLTNGTVYYYVVSAVDAIGNESASSSEASGTPADVVAPATPLLLVSPVLAGGKSKVYRNSIDIAGNAEPGSSVELFKDNVSTGKTVASLTETTEKVHVDYPGNDATPSPDGTYIVYTDNTSGALMIMDVSSGTARQIADYGWNPVWSPYGDKIAYQYDDPDWNTRIGIFDVEAQKAMSLTDDPSVYEKSPSWSDDGSKIAYNSDRGNSWGIWVKDFVTGNETEMNLAADYPSLSPNGAKIAYFNGSRLSIMSLDDGATLLVDENTDGYTLAWSPDSNKVVFESSLNGDQELYIMDLTARNRLQITANSNKKVYPAWSPDEQSIVYGRKESDGANTVWLADLQGQSRLLISIGHLSSLDWGKTGTIAFVDRAGKNVYTVNPQGQFIFKDVILNQGENVFTAIATDDGGNASPVSDAISVVYDMVLLPDIAVTNNDISVYPLFPKPGEDFMVNATVRNFAQSPVDNVDVDVYLWDSAGGLQLIKSATIPHMAAYAEAEVDVAVNAGLQNGAQTIIVVADPANKAKESLEGNNSATKEFYVTDKEEVRVAAIIDAVQYTSGQDAVVTIAVKNSGRDRDGVLNVVIEDDSGNRVALLDSIAGTMPYGANTYTYRWNCGATLAGSYRTHVVFTGTDGAATESSASFTILPDVRIDSSVVADKQGYGANENVAITTNLRNSGSNYILLFLKIRTKIVDSSNNIVFSDERDVKDLFPGTGTSLASQWNTGLNAPGDYRATVEAYLDDRLISSSLTSVTIGPVHMVRGTVAVDPAAVPIGTSFKTVFTTSNSGNIAAGGIVKAYIVDPDSRAIVATEEQPLTVPMNGNLAGEFSFSAQGLQPKAYLVSLRFVSQGTEKSIASSQFVVNDVTPPVVTVVSPVQGTTYNASISITALASDNAAGVEKVEYQLDEGAWKLLPPADSVSGRYAVTWSPLSTDNGVHNVSIRATDRAKNTSAPVTVAFTFLYVADYLPPLLRLSTLSDGASTNNGMLNVAGSVWDDTAVQGLEINGGNVLVNSDGSFSYALALQSGANDITTSAIDLAGNRTIDVRTITLDQMVPVLTVTSPADNSKTGNAVVTVVGTVDDESATVTVKVNDTVQTAAQTGNTVKTDVFLIPGYNTIEITATDLAGNQSTAKRTAIFDDRKPSLAITEPGQDIQTNQSSLTIRGTASDPYTAVSITISMDDQTYTPTVVDGAFEQTLSLTNEKSYAISVTATNEVGTATTVQRNIIYDITPPAFSVDGVKSPTNQKSQTISGTRETGASVAVSCATAVVGDVTYPTATAWSAVVSGFSNGANDIAISSTDSTGNIVNATVRIIYETTPPIGAIEINNGATITGSTQVQLDLSATDENGVSQMRFSTDGANWTAPEAYVSSRSWTLDAGDGVKLLFVQYGDAAGNWSDAYSASIVLHEIPKVTLISPLAGFTNSESPLLKFTVTLGSVVVKVDGVAVSKASGDYLDHLSDGQHVVRVEATTAFGVSGFAEVAFTVDTVAPTVTITSPAGNALVNKVPLLNYTVSDGAAVVKVDGTVVSKGSGDYLGPLAEGPHEVRVEATDVAGNTGVGESNFIVDATPPVLRIPLTTSVTALTAGESHSVELRPDGTLWAWGYNYYGQLGNGTTTNNNAPSQIGTDSDWSAVASGVYHTLALKKDGSLWAWGANGHGELGDDTLINRFTPVRIGTASDWAAVSAGNWFSLALKKDGTLWAWGYNGNGQLGDGTYLNRYTPVRIGTGTDWSFVTGRHYNTVALKKDGSLWGWGNSYGPMPVQIGTDKNWAALAAGNSHGLALKKDGTLWAWGMNGNGQLGDGTTITRNNPVMIGSDHSWSKIASGAYHSLAVKSDGTLWGWGYNYYGQLGDGTTNDRLAPIQLGTDNDWLTATGGGNHTLALRTDGTIWSWGGNWYGQLGNGAWIEKHYPVMTKQYVNGVYVRNGIVYSNSQTVMLKIDAFDANGVSEMQLRNESSDWSLPEPYSMIKKWPLSAGDGPKTVYVKVKDSIGNWSEEEYSYSVILDTRPAVFITSPQPGMTNSASPMLNYIVSSGAVVVKMDGAVVSKVSGSYLGPLSEGPHIVRAEATDTSGRTNYAEVSFTVDTISPVVVISSPATASYTNVKTPQVIYTVSDGTPVVKVDGVVVSKSSGSYLDLLADGQHTVSVEATDLAGNKGDAQSSFVVDTVAPTVTINSPSSSGTFGQTPLLTYTASDGVIVVKVDGVTVSQRSGEKLDRLTIGLHTIRVEATDSAGNMGYAESTFNVVSSPLITITSPSGLISSRTPLLVYTVSEGTLVVKVDGVVVSKTSGMSLDALADGQHTVRVEATNTSGVTEYADMIFTVDTIPPTLTTPFGPALSMIAAGDGYTVILKPDGTLWAWGYNDYGQLGDGTTLFRSTPVQIGTDSDWAAVSTSRDHTLALKADGSLWAWGSNGYGELGDGTNVGKLIPTRIGTGNDWMTISAGHNFSLALKKDGSLWAWGWNYLGQLGNGNTVDQKVPVRVGVDNQWTVIAAGQAVSLAIKKNGTLWGFGYQYTSTPTQVGSDNDWKAISNGWWHHLALKTNGTLWAWGGNNGNGQIGDGTTQPSYAPKRIGTDSNWIAISAGWKHSLALKSNGTLWAWGYNIYGALGTGNAVTQYSPVQTGTANNWSVIAGGCYHSVAIKSDGTLWAWGANWNGLLGDGTTSDRYNPVQVPQKGGGIYVNNGVTYSSSRIVILKIDAFDANGVAEMQLRNENSDWSLPEPYSIIKKWTLSAGDGAKTVYVKLKDHAGNWSDTFSFSVTLLEIPTVSISSPAAGLTNNNKPLLNYTVSGGTVTVRVDGNVVAKEAGDNLDQLSDGSHTVRVEATLPSGTGFAETSFTVDTIPPTVVISSPEANGVVKYKTPQLTYSVSDGTVVVKVDGEVVSKVSGNNLGPFYDGQHTGRVEATDLAGNVGYAESTFTVNTTPPVVVAAPAGGVYKTGQSVTLTANETAIIYYTTDGSSPTTGSSVYSQPILIPVSTTLKFFASDPYGNMSNVKTESYVIDTVPPVLTVFTLSDGAYTNNETLNITGTVKDNTGVRQLQINGTIIPVDGEGGFSHALVLQDGANIVSVTATDLADNQTSDSRTVNLEKAAPLLIVTTPADNAKIGEALLTVSGKADETSTVLVKHGDNVQTAMMNSGTFTATVNLVSGCNNIEIMATDLAGKRSTVKRTVVFDDQKPSLAVTEPNQDIRTNQGSLTIKGTVFDVLTAVNVTITKDNETFTPSVVNGAFEQVINFAEEKTYAIIVKAANEVGATTSVQRNIILDITPPALTISPVTSPTDQTSQTISGTREAGDAVTVNCTTALVGEVIYPTATSWQVTLDGLGEGMNLITATSTDAVGNLATASTSIILTTSLPELTITATPNIIWPPDHRMVAVKIGGVIPQGTDMQSAFISLADEYGKYSYDNLKLGDTVLLEAWRNGNDLNGRTYTITMVATDKAGNTTTKTTSVLVPHDLSK